MKPIRLLVAYAAGGPSDIIGRTLAAKVGELIGGTIIVENRLGAGGNIAFEAGAKAPPDGYTLLVGAGAMTIMPAIHPKLGYDVVRDLTPISLAAMSTFVVMVRPAVPAKSTAEFFQSMVKVKLTHVPYKCAVPALVALVSGECNLYFGGIATASPQVKSGRLRGLAVTSKTRAAALPGLPTLDESGLRGFDISTWFGLMATAGTPTDIIAKLNAAVVNAVTLADVRDTLGALGFEPRSSTSAEFVAHVKDEVRKFALIVKASGAKFE